MVLKSSGGIFPHRPFKKRHLLGHFCLLRLPHNWEIGNQRFNHGMAQVFRGTDVVKMFAGQEMKTRIAPMAFNHGVRPELIAVPGRKDETAGKLFELGSEFRFVGFGP